jgi:hypothetical protein
LTLGFRRHKRPKAQKKKSVPQIALGYAQYLTFSVGQDYSLKGCSSAEPFSAYLGSIKEKAYHFIYTNRLFNKVWGLGR